MICNYPSFGCPLGRTFASRNKFLIFSRTLTKKQDEAKNVKKINKSIGFIGDGNMAKAICQSIVNKGLISYSQVYVSSPYKNNLDIWAKWNANVTVDNCTVAEKADIIFLAVKPIILHEAVGQMCNDKRAENIRNKLFISVLAGITLETLSGVFSKLEGSRIIRIMPNTPMMVGEGCTVYCKSKTVTDEDVSIITSILEVSGICEEVPEDMINAVGALAASGPAFVFLMIEALSDGAVKMGVHREMATKFAAQTLLGAAKMVLETGKHTGELKDQVCSSKGTTIAGIHALERGGFRGAIMDAIEASAKRALELSLKKD